MPSCHRSQDTWLSAIADRVSPEGQLPRPSTPRSPSRYSKCWKVAGNEVFNAIEPHSGGDRQVPPNSPAGANSEPPSSTERRRSDVRLVFGGVGPEPHGLLPPAPPNAYPGPPDRSPNCSEGFSEPTLTAQALMSLTGELRLTLSQRERGPENASRPDAAGVASLRPPYACSLFRSPGSSPAVHGDGPAEASEEAEVDGHRRGGEDGCGQGHPRPS